MNRIAACALGLVLALSLTACAPNAQTATPPQTGTPAAAPTQTPAEQFPFTLTTKDDMSVTFTQVPQTILCTNVNTGDQLMAMGLGDKIVATCNNNTRVAEEYRAAYEAIPVLSEKAPGLEAVLDLAPDFIYGRSSAFSEKALGTHDTLSGYGLVSLSSIEGYKLGADLEDVYQDFYNLGRIFQLEDRAEEIVSGMKAKVADVQGRVEGQAPVKVLVYDAGRENGVYTCGNNFTATLIRYAGGENIFSEMEKTWDTVSYEAVVERAPDFIVINDYGDTTLEQKIQEMKENPALSTLEAVQNDRFIAVTLCESFASSMTADTVEKFAMAFHPDCFG